jgi:hypothetical protein
VREGRGERERTNFEGARFEERLSGRLERAACRQYVIDQPYARRCAQAMCHAECASHVLTPLAANQPGLLARVMETFEQFRVPRSRETLGNSLCDRIDMVEASPAASAGVEGDTDDEIGARGRLPDDPSCQLGGEMVDR